MLFFRVTRSVKSDNRSAFHGSLNPGNRSFGYFSRPLLEGYLDFQNQYRLIAKSLAVAEVNPLLQGISAFVESTCILEQKYKRGVVSKVFSEIESECNTIRLGDCVSILRGGSPRPIDAYITNHPDGINWIKIGDTSADELYITRTKEKIIPSGIKKSRRVFQGDLILSNSMSFGRPYILQIDGCIHDGWLLIRDEENVFEKRFLCYYLGSDNVIAQYKRFAAGSCVNNLNSELVGNVEICCPPRSTQHEIADMLTVLDSRIAHANRTYEALLRMRTSFLQQLFI